MSTALLLWAYTWLSCLSFQIGVHDNPLKDLFKNLGPQFLKKLLILVAVTLCFTAAKLFNDIKLSSVRILELIATWSDIPFYNRIDFTFCKFVMR